ncbi:hypothetical protein Q3G72_000515 [Acer saccharum]|nr:hypothetical protein Q3G72_000515 [Acer saccharum]
MLKTLKDQHNCHRIYNNKETKVKWIASKFEKLVKSNPNVDVKVKGDLLRENYKMSVEIQRLYRAKHRALKELAKVHANCFGYLMRNLTFMSDRQKGVIAALELHFPFAHRRYYARYIYANFKLTYKGDHYKKLFWRAARSSNVYDFKSAMEEIGIINPAAKKWLKEIDSQHWNFKAYESPRTVQPGRHKKQRKKKPDEAPKRSSTVICKLCHQVGHNKRFCQRRNENQTQGGSVGASYSHQPNQTPPPQSQVTQQLFD